MEFYYSEIFLKFFILSVGGWMLSAGVIAVLCDLHETVGSSYISISHHTAEQTALNNDSKTTYTQSTEISA
jgi:hypothetical protein